MSTLSGILQQPETNDPRIGPNAILQTWRALDELEASSVGARVRALSRLPESLPAGMIPEAWFVRLVDVLRRELEPDRADHPVRMHDRERLPNRSRRNELPRIPLSVRMRYARGHPRHLEIARLPSAVGALRTVPGPERLQHPQHKIGRAHV